ncbi:MAG: sterol desaturase family protein, partial [Bacteroidetes bacterium]|nr:sterol desaturase family protein [Bacteroidota bacterium]
PEMHRWHHSDDDGEEYKNNYSTKLAVWDFIFRTDFFPDPKKRKPVRYGLKDTPYYPSNFFRQFLFAFRKENKVKHA